MTYLLHIGFDNSMRLCRKTHYFEYKGVRFKLIQNNPRRWSDALLTILPDHNDVEAQAKVYCLASEFLSALSWQNHARVKLQNLGGRGCKVPDLRKALCSHFTFPQIPFGGMITGHEITRIPHIETQEQRDALILLREAHSTNNDYLAFLFFWQVLGIGKTQPIGWVNKTLKLRPHGLRLSSDYLSKLQLDGKRLGEYFYTDCRCAISHLFELKKGKKIRIDSLEDNSRIAASKNVLENFARFYISDVLKLNKSMYLVRKHGTRFPMYMSEDEMSRIHFKIAYERPRLTNLQKNNRSTVH